MSGYVIVNYTVKDQEMFGEYPAKSLPTLVQHGGKILVADPKAEVIEGEPHQVTAIIEFESVEAAKQWYNSPENEAVKHLRIGSTDGWLIIANEFVKPS